MINKIIEVDEFIVFIGTPHYPEGGNGDFLQYTSSVEDAIELITKEGNLEKLKRIKDITGNDIWVSIATTETMETIKSGLYADWKEECEWQDGDFDHYKIQENKP